MNDTPNAFEILPLEDVVPGEVAAFDPVAAGEKMAKETAVMEVHIRRPGFTKPIPPGHFILKIKEAGEQAMTAEQEAILEQYRSQIVQRKGPNGEMTDTTMLHVSQDILDRKEIAIIVNHDDKFSAWLKAQAIPSPMLAAGMYQIRLHRFTEVENAIEAFVKRRRILINNFRDRYLALKEKAKAGRWPFYDEADYPAWELIEAKYRVEARPLTFNVPAALERINSDIYKKYQAQAKLQWADAAQEAFDMQRAAFSGLLEHYTEMLGRDDTGKRKSFRPAAVKKLQEFLTVFNEMNVGDLELERVVNQVREVVAGVDVAALKKDMTLRDAIQPAFAKLKDMAASLVTVRERKVVFEDEEEQGAITTDRKVVFDDHTDDDDALPLN